MWREIYTDEWFWNQTEKLIRMKAFRVNASGRIEIVKNRTSQIINYPWIVFNNRRGRNCPHWLDVCWGYYKFIPNYCRNHCFKVVFKPETVKDLVCRVLPTMAGTGCWGKCGLDLRRYTENKYLAVFYAESMDEGLERLAMARKLFPDLNPMLKRMCTEMEDKYPEPPEENKDWDALESKTTDMFDTKPHTIVVQTEWIKNGILFNWMRHARKMGDMTYKEVVGDIFHTVGSKYYEAEES